MAMHLGVYALGSADAAEKRLVEAHLPRCAACRAELAHLEPLQQLLGRLSAEMLPDFLFEDLPAARVVPAGSHRHAGSSRTPDRPRHHLGGHRPAAHAHPPTRTRRVVSAAAVTATAAGLAGGFWLMSTNAAPTPPPADQTVSAADPVTHVRATAALTSTTWGTSVQVVADGLPRNQVCWLVIHSRTGKTEVSAYWDEWSHGPVSVRASSPWKPSDISSVQVVTGGGVLLTIAMGTAPPPAPAPSGG
ncbi:MAG TPA: hypothetical protein VFU73_14665 [Actinocrinis sp.]|nr:hypothetical protein [Actinocrinis sp.]